MSFFAAGFSCLALLIALAAAILAMIIDLDASETGRPQEIWLVILVFLPILPIFFTFGLLFLEWYFNVLRLGWLVGLGGKPFLTWFLQWSGAEH